MKRATVIFAASVLALAGVVLFLFYLRDHETPAEAEARNELARQRITAESRVRVEASKAFEASWDALVPTGIVEKLEFPATVYLRESLWKLANFDGKRVIAKVCSWKMSTNGDLIDLELRDYQSGRTLARYDAATDRLQVE